MVIEDQLGDRSLESQVLRLVDTPRVRERPVGRRELSEIPPSELFMVLDRIQSSSTTLLQDDKPLARSLLEHYGFTRLTEVRRKHRTRILDVYHRQRRIESTG
jgi:hypothetical protein